MKDLELTINKCLNEITESFERNNGNLINNLENRKILESEIMYLFDKEIGEIFFKKIIITVTENEFNKCTIDLKFINKETCEEIRDIEEMANIILSR